MWLGYDPVSHPFSADSPLRNRYYFLYDSYEIAYFDQIKSVLKPRMKLFNRGRIHRLNLKNGIKLWFLIDLFEIISVGKIPLNSIT